MKSTFIGLAIATILATGAFAKSPIINDCKIVKDTYNEDQHKPWYKCKEKGCLINPK